MANNNPKISVVVIGINREPTLSACLNSVLKLDYPQLVEVIYVDGGSKDSSVAVARSIPGVKVLELNLKHPTPGRLRLTFLLKRSFRTWKKKGFYLIGRGKEENKF